MSQTNSKSKNILIAGSGAFISHLICCGPMIAAATLGVTLSTSFIGVACFATTGAAYMVAYGIYKTQTMPQACCAPKREITFIKSRSFRNASILSAGIALGVAFNVVADHSHHTHSNGNGQNFDQYDDLCSSVRPPMNL